MLNPTEGQTEIPFADYLINELGMVDIGFKDFYRTYRLQNENTDLVLGFDKRQYRVSDGRIWVNRAYWRGQLSNGEEAANKLREYAGNLDRGLPLNP